METLSLETQLEFIIDRLQNAINVCNQSITDPEKGYSYASGYADSAMKGCVSYLSDIMVKIRDEV